MAERATAMRISWPPPSSVQPSRVLGFILVIFRLYWGECEDDTLDFGGPG